MPIARAASDTPARRATTARAPSAFPALVSPVRPTRLAALLLTLATAASAVATAAAGAQERPDLQAWYGATLDVALPDDLRAAFRYQARFVDDASRYRVSYLTLEPSWRPSPALTVLASYRLGLADGVLGHRVTLGSEGTHVVAGTTVQLRPMVQTERLLVDDGESHRHPTFVTRARPRLQVRHALLSHVEGYAYTEPYFRIGSGAGLDYWRDQVGLVVGYAKHRRADLFYIYRPAVDGRGSRTYHAVGIDLGFSASRTARHG